MVGSRKDAKFFRKICRDFIRVYKLFTILWIPFFKILLLKLMSNPSLIPDNFQ